MKKLILPFVAIAFLTSCGSHCNINKWRCRRFVDAPKVQQPPAETPQVKQV